MKSLRPRTRPSSHGRSHKATSSRFYLRSTLSQVARECRPSEEGKWEMENLRGLHRPEQSMPKRQFPLTQDRPAYGFNSWAQVTDVHGRLLRIQPDQDGRGRSREDLFHHELGTLLLQGNAFWTEERRGYIPEVSKQNVQ